MRAIRLYIAVGMIALLLGGARDAASAQDSAAGRRVMEPRVDSPPVEPTLVGPDPDAEIVRRFSVSLEATRAAALREARINAARRIAPFDLDWGLQ